MIALYKAKVLINLFGPQLKFTIKNNLGAALDSVEFVLLKGMASEANEDCVLLKGMASAVPYAVYLQHGFSR